VSGNKLATLSRKL